MSAETIQQSVERWLSFVQAFSAAYAHGERLSGGQGSGQTDSGCRPELALRRARHKPPLVLLCSPHPDDEMLTGVLPLRLLREQGARVVNLAVTLGSNLARQAERWAELQEACAVVGFDCQRLRTPLAFDLKAGTEGEGWLQAVAGLVELLTQMNPDLVFYPHASDAHPAHIGTNRLAAAALARWTAAESVSVTAVETEYWSSMAAPNLLVGVSSQDLACLLAALSCHRGEIARNPYHLVQPARLMDSVRRGAELIKSTTLTRPGFLFGELYRLSLWRQGRNQPLSILHGWSGPGQGLEGLVG